MEAFFLAETFEKVSFDPHNFRITRLLARKSEQMKSWELYSRWVPLTGSWHQITDLSPDSRNCRSLNSLLQKGNSIVEIEKEVIIFCW